MKITGAIEVRNSEGGVKKVKGAGLDVMEIISKVRSFVERVKEFSAADQPITINMEGFSFSAGKVNGVYDLTLQLNLTFKPKTNKPNPAE